MKKILLSLVLALLSLTSNAELPKNMKVYTTGSPGPTLICRTLFEEYDKIYNTSTIFVVKPGASGMLAMLQMINDKEFSVTCLTGLSESIFNSKEYPGYESEHSKLTMVSTVMMAGVYFVTGNSNRYNNIQELVSANSSKEITIGYPSPAMRFIIDNMFPGKKILLVPFKSSNEAIPSLMDGSLDFYVDPGSLLQLIRAGKLKSIGNLNGIQDSFSGPDMSKVYSKAASIKVFAGVSTSIDNNAADISELNKRLNILLDTEIMKNTVAKINGTILKGSVKQSNELVENIKREYDIWK